MSTAANPVETKKWTCEYQATDEQGNPIGRKTILGPFDTAEELIEAQRKQNEAAVRAYFRLKNANPDPAKPRHEFKPKSLTPDEQIQIAAEAKQPSTQQTAFRKQLEAELGAPVETVRETLQTVPNLDIKAEVEQFVAAHAWKDYYPDPGGQNKAKILGFLQTHNPPLAITANNLEIALETLREELLPVPSPVRPPEPPPAPPAPSIIPGQFGGTGSPARRTGEASRWPTKAEAKAMADDPKTKAKYRALLKNPEFVRFANSGEWH